MRVLAALAFALGLAGCSAAPGVPAPTPDLARAICADPPVDRAYPAAGTGIRIKSHGQAMNGMLYQPAGKGPHPVVVLCHGLPGNEQNLDLAQAVRRAGWAVVTYHYRGSWGSEGSFSIEGTLDDVDAVLAHLRNPETARAWRIDPKRMVVVGHSLGGFDAAHAGAHAADVIGTALLAPWDPSLDAAQLSTLDRAARDRLAATDNDVDGRVTGATNKDIMAAIWEKGASWRLADNAGDLASRPLFIAIAARDGDNCKALALSRALKDAGAAKTRMVTFDTDHGFNDHRVALEVSVLGWLTTLPGAPPLE